MYSSIKTKKCKCGCGKYPAIGCGGYSYSCMPDDLKEKVGGKRKLQIQKRNAAKYASTKLRMTNYQDNSALKNWFKFHMINSKMKCENCGADLSHYNETDWKGSQHHIIEKSGVNGCPSVSTNLLNHGVLGKWCCHSQWHTSYANAVKMPFFKIAKERFELFKDKIIESERKHIPEVLLNELKKKI